MVTAAENQTMNLNIIHYLLESNQNLQESILMMAFSKYKLPS
jgi:hypothetical protein